MPGVRSSRAREHTARKYLDKQVAHAETSFDDAHRVLADAQPAHAAAESGHTAAVAQRDAATETMILRKGSVHRILQIFQRWLYPSFWDTGDYSVEPKIS